MKKLNIIHLGIGNVGTALVRMILDNREKLQKDFGADLIYCGLFNSKGGIFELGGLLVEELIQFPSNSKVEAKFAVDEISSPFVLIDTTASEATYPLLMNAFKKGGYVVMSNKKQLSSSQKLFDLLQRSGKKKLFYETTVGAGLPVISTLKNLLLTGDEVLEIKGCFSGTLGFIFSQLEDGNKFSETVKTAKKMGYTEPDPRDDLSGLDVARKALILSRLLGRSLGLSDIKLASLYPDSMSDLTIDDFLEKITRLDDQYKKKIEVAQKNGQTLRFVATVTPEKCIVGLETVSKDSDLGGLKGPDNMIIFKTKRYFDRPMVIKGPGAGPEVTAAGVFGDILTIARNVYSI